MSISYGPLNLDKWLKFSVQWSSTLFASNLYLADTGGKKYNVAGGNGEAAQMGYPLPAPCVVRELRVRCTVNTSTTNFTATVYKNNVATAITVTVTAGSTAEFSDLTNAVAFAAGDRLDIFCTGNNGTGAVIFSATLVARPI